MSFQTASSVAFHLSVNVSDIDRSVAFFSKVFGVKPAKHRPDYAKFELTNPPLTFSLEPSDPASRGVLNHVGFKFQSAAELVEIQRHLEAAGIRSEREEGVECCYSRQTKFWLHDPDGTLWEMYVLEDDIDHRGAGQDATAVLGTRELPQSIESLNCQSTSAAPSNWSHRLGTPFELSRQISRESLEQVQLQGSFNAAGSSAATTPFLAEVFGVLKPGGIVQIHCLTANAHLESAPPLPGPAAVVKETPCLDSLMNSLERAGFVSMRLTKYSDQPCFVIDGIEFRETRIEASRPLVCTGELVSVVYRGPFAEIKFDSGEILCRGRKGALKRSTYDQVQQSPVRDSLVLTGCPGATAGCGNRTSSMEQLVGENA